MRTILGLRASFYCFLVFVVTGQVARSQNWTGLGDGETWLDGSNWDNGIAPQFVGDLATFDTNFGVPQKLIQISGPISVGRIDIVNGTGNVRIADDEPLHPFLGFQLDNAGSSVLIRLDSTPGNSLSFEESVGFLQFNDDVDVDHHGPTSDVFSIKSNVVGGRSLQFLPGTGRAELVGSSFQLHNLLTEIEIQLGDVNPNGQLDAIGMSGDFRIGSGGKVSSRAFTSGVGSLDVNGSLRIEPGGFTSQDGSLNGGGAIEVMDLATVRVMGSANLFNGKANLFGGTLSVGGTHGPGAQVVLHQYGTIGTTQPFYDPTLDPAVVVDPSVTIPGSVGFALDNQPAYSMPIDLNFNNGVANSYRLGSANLSRIPFGTPITPFDDGVSQPTYYFGGPGHLFIDTTLTDSPITGNSTGFVMPTFPTSEPGVNFGAIFLTEFTSFTGRVRVEQEQLVLAHPLAVAAAGSMDIVATGTQYDGGNFVHGTIVLEPGLIGSYSGPAPQLNGGAFGFTSAHILSSLPTVGGLLGPATFDATNFGGGSPTSTLFALSGFGGITQSPAFAIDNSLSSSGNQVVLVITDQAFVELTRPNLHTGGTAVVGHSLLLISDSNQLGPGPLNIADGATLRVTATSSIFNELDLHDAVAFGNSTIEVPSGVSADFRGSMSTKDAQQGTFTKRGTGRLVFDPSTPWSPSSGENSWGLRLVEGEAVLAQLPEWDDPALRWKTGPLVLSTINGSLFVTTATVANATNPDNAGFRVLNVDSGIGGARVTIDAGAELKLAGVDDHHQILGGVQKLGQGVMWLGGDSSGGDAVGSDYNGRGNLDIREGTVRIGNLPGTDDLARAFPDDIVLRIQRFATLQKIQDQPGRVQSLYIDDAIPGIGFAFMTLSPSGVGLGDGSLNADIGPLGTFHLDGALIKDGAAPLRLSARPGATISIAGGFSVDDGTLEVDASGIDPLTDTVTSTSAAVTTNGPGTLHVTAGTVRVNALTGTGRTRVEAGARLISPTAAVQRIYEIDGELAISSAFPFAVVDELLTGQGQVTGGVSLNGASLAPNDDVNPLVPTPATFTITGNLTMGITDEVNIDVSGGTFTNDFVKIGGTANLGGALTIDVHSPFNSLGTSSHLILDAAAGVSSLFNVTPNVGDYLGAGVEFGGITYAASGSVVVDLLQTAYADFNNDGMVDGIDLGIWQSGYGATGVGIHSLGDADLDGDVDGRDFLTWQRQSGTVFVTLPSITPGNVPEPSALVLCCSCVLLSRRQILRAT